MEIYNFIRDVNKVDSDNLYPIVGESKMRVRRFKVRMEGFK